MGYVIWDMGYGICDMGYDASDGDKVTPLRYDKERTNYICT